MWSVTSAQYHMYTRSSRNIEDKSLPQSSIPLTECACIHLILRKHDAPSRPRCKEIGTVCVEPGRSYGPGLSRVPHGTAAWITLRICP